jgi:hypothetical protein
MISPLAGRYSGDRQSVWKKGNAVWWRQDRFFIPFATLQRQIQGVDYNRIDVTPAPASGCNRKMMAACDVNTLKMLNTTGSKSKRHNFNSLKTRRIKIIADYREWKLSRS